MAVRPAGSGGGGSAVSAAAAGAQRGGELGVARLDRRSLAGELERVEAVRGGLAAGEHVLRGEPEAVERGGGGRAGLRAGELEAAPAGLRQAHPFAARLQQERDLVGRERGVLDAERDREVEPVVAAVGREGGEIDVRAQRRAEQGGELRGGVDAEAGRERGVPGEELLGKVLRDGPRPRVVPRGPVEPELGEARAHGVGGGEIEFEQRVVGAARGGGLALGPLPAALAAPLLRARGLGGTGEELRAKRGRDAVRFVDPARELRAQGDPLHLDLEGGGQTQAGRAQAQRDLRIGERGEGQCGCGERRRAGPELFLEEIVPGRGGAHGRGGGGVAASGVTRRSSRRSRAAGDGTASRTRGAGAKGSGSPRRLTISGRSSGVPRMRPATSADSPLATP